MNPPHLRRSATGNPASLGRWLFLAAVVLTTIVYASGLSGGFLFDDYPNIVDNKGVQPDSATVSSLVGAVLSSPSSEFKRPLASLSFAANYLATGLDPFWMKLTNLVIHLLNGLLVFLLARALLLLLPLRAGGGWEGVRLLPRDGNLSASAFPLLNPPPLAGEGARRAGIVAALLAAGWMLLPINLTGVLYVVQRMESMANLFVLLGLVGYVTGRCRMLSQDGSYTRGLMLCIASVIVPTAVGMMAKETAVMLPLYAFFFEAIAFRFNGATARPLRRDRWLILLYMIVLALPFVVGLTWLLPSLLRPSAFSTRDFTMGTRLLSEARIVIDYIGWTLLPMPHHLSFYHDYFHISTGLLKPWTTLASIITLVALVVLAWWSRRRYPLVTLGIALYLGCHLLTGTILPLELIYEHRNYFASFGLLLAIVPLLASPPTALVGGASAPTAQHHETDDPEATQQSGAGAPPTTEANPDGAEKTGSAAPAGLPMALPRYVLLGGLLALWTLQTALTAYAWGNPLRLAQDLAARAPTSPRAQYELGRTYIIYSHYDPASVFTKLAYAPLERSAALPDSSILAEQALIFMNSRMNLPLKDAWWDSMVAKLKANRPGVQDESSLGALTQCAREQNCDLPKDRMMEAFLAALSHPSPSARLLAIYGDYAWNVLDDKTLGERMLTEAVKAKPDEPAYHITLIRMLAARGRNDEAREAIKQLETLNIGGRLDGSIAGLRALLPPQ